MILDFVFHRRFSYWDVLCLSSGIWAGSHEMWWTALFFFMLWVTVGTMGEMRALRRRQRPEPATEYAKLIDPICPVCREGDHAFLHCTRPDCTDGRNMIERKSS